MGENHVLIVMDALKEFSIEPLECFLSNNPFNDSCTITLLGVRPWVNIPINSNTLSNTIWSVDIEELLTKKEEMEGGNNVKYKPLLDLCKRYGVVPQIKWMMGSPLKVVVLERITALNPIIVVFDRYHSIRNVEFYANKCTSIIVVMNEDGGADLIKPHFKETHTASEESTS
ncbi:hypothetical protein LguiA_033997 [Lonicera macranthoides]